MSVLIKGGRVVTASDDWVGDVYVEDERVTLLGEALDVAADRVVDAAGKWVLPGAVDPHTHLAMPLDDLVTADDFESGQRAAARGGTTTHVDFANQTPGRPLAEALAEWHARAEGRTLIDYGFHVTVCDLRDGETLAELKALPDLGVTSFKLLLAYKGRLQVDDATLLRVLEVARDVGALVLVHGENGDVVDLLVRRALAAGHREPGWHYRTRPPALEGEATARAIALAGLAEAPLYVVHVTCREALEAIERARRAGRPVFGETCPQYLLLDETRLDLPGFEGAKYVLSPPLRPASHQQALWEALRTDVLSTVGTDHCSFTFAEQKRRGLDDFSRIPNGGPGIEERLLLLHHFGVGRGLLTPSRLVEVCSTSPARLLGLYPRKGTIAVGSDADLVVFDPTRRRTLAAATQQSACDYSLYEGTEVVGDVELVLLRGRVLVEDGEVVAPPGVGRFVRRARFGERLESARAAVAG